MAESHLWLAVVLSVRVGIWFIAIILYHTYMHTIASSCYSSHVFAVLHVLSRSYLFFSTCSFLSLCICLIDNKSDWSSFAVCWVNPLKCQLSWTSCSVTVVSALKIHVAYVFEGLDNSSLLFCRISLLFPLSQVCTFIWHVSSWTVYLELHSQRVLCLVLKRWKLTT